MPFYIKGLSLLSFWSLSLEERLYSCTHRHAHNSLNGFLSPCIRGGQEVETIGHKTCWRAPSLLWFGVSSFYAMQSLLFTFLLSAPRLSVLNDVGFVHRCVYLSWSSILWPSSWSCLPASRCNYFCHGWFQAAGVVPLTLDLQRDAVG